MKTIKAKDWRDVPSDYTGIVEIENQETAWLKDGFEHREDGPAIIYHNGPQQWWLDGKYIWSRVRTLDLTNKIILSKSQHSLYPTVQIWKILDKNGLYEQILIPGMEEYIQE